MPWEVLSSGPMPPSWNMEVDKEALENIQENQCRLRFYEWDLNAITFGYFIDPKKHFKKTDLNLARRPTGGGIIFHEYDLAFSILVPSIHPFYSLNPLESYQKINQVILEAVAKVLNKKVETFTATSSTLFPNFCMAKPTIYDLLLEGKKVGGAAQRKTKRGLLHQGSICLEIAPKSLLEEVIINGESLHDEMCQWSYPIGRQHQENLITTIQGHVVNHDTL